VSAATVFDRVAARYDELWTNTAVGRAQRDQVWRVADPLFQPGQRILDIGCGTGEDAAHFAARGIAVHATDASPAMVRMARARGISAVLCSAQDLASIRRTFHGAISNFGALNCVEDLPSVADSLAALVRPGGTIAICVLGRFCAWETLYYGARFNWRKAFRRWRSARVSYQGITVHYPSVRELPAAFAPHFDLQRWTGIGLLVPPSYVNLPADLVGVLATFDRLLARLPLLRALSDHRLFVLVRKSC
jgi:ubiquinone/menaquinone biosynthesis C-methylase UbiE